jgi:large subunit ribosomal protein L19
MEITAHISPVNVGDRKNLDIRSGDTVRVWQKIQERGKTRLQMFEGLVLARKHGSEPGGTFTVRKVSSGIGIEKIFPLYSPMIDRIEVVRRAKVRRSKLYYIREKAAREIRRQMRKMTSTNISTVSDIEEKESVAKAEEARLAQETQEAAAAEAAIKAQEEAAVAAQEPENTEAEETKKE